MRFLGGLFTFFSFLIMVASTAICIFLAKEEPRLEVYIVMMMCWACAAFASLLIWGIGLSLTSISKLKKKNEQLEQKIEKLIWRQAFTIRNDGTDISKADTEKEAPDAEMPVPERTASEKTAPMNPELLMREMTSVEEKKSKKWLPAVVIGIICLLLLIIILIIAGLVKDKAGEVQESDVIAEDVTSKKEEKKAKEASTEIKATPVKLGGKIENELFTMSFDSVEIVDEYSFKTGEHSSHSLYVEDGYKLLMVRGLFVNNHTSVIKDNSFSLEAVVNETYVAEERDVRLAFERSTTHEIDPYTEQDYVLYLNIPEKLADSFKEATFAVGFNDDLSAPVTVSDSKGNRTVEVDQKYSITSGISAAASVAEEVEATAITIGETVYTEDYEFTLRNVEMSYEVLPSNTSSVYTSYPAESGKVFIHVEADVKNTMQRDLRIEEIFTASAMYDSKYPYSGFTIVDDGNRFDWLGSYVAATPLETCQAHSLIACPVEVDTSGKPVVVYLELGDEIFEFAMR